MVRFLLTSVTVAALLAATAGAAAEQPPAGARGPDTAQAGSTPGSTTPAPTTPPAATNAAPTPEAAAGDPATTTPAPASDAAPQPPAVPLRDAVVNDARDNFDRRDAAKLELLRSLALSQGHPLASWVDYWTLSSKLSTASNAEVQEFFTRWRGRYVEDRLRNDWLLELGKRRDWATFAADHPRFRMADDREVTCWALLAEHSVKPIGAARKAAAMEAWLAQTSADDGCVTLARTLVDGQLFERADVWLKVREAVATNRLPAARQAATLLSGDVADAVAEAINKPQRHLDRKAGARFDAADAQALDAVAIARLAANDPEQAARLVRARRGAFTPRLDAWVWAQLARQAGFKTLPVAFDYTREWFALLNKLPKAQHDLNDEALAWAARNALRATDPTRWAVLERAIALMRPAQSGDITWRYWQAKAAHESAAAGPKGDDARAAARRALRELAGQPPSYVHYYGMLATEELGEVFRAPEGPAPLSAAEAKTARGHVGLNSALALIALGLRDEGNREWNWSLRGMTERELLAASQLACEREIWDRCINTSERTREGVDLVQRYPLPYRQPLVDRSQAQGLDAALTFGLVRQESRFLAHTRSSAGAGGLMQLMPRTAKWTATKLGISDYKPERLYEPDVNAALGTGYLKMVLDEFGGSQALAAAAYNAGPHRARRWREGAAIDAAAWVETIPFNETRDYVKRVLSNAVVYSQRLGESSSLRQRLGATIGPPVVPAAVRTDLP